MRNEPSRRLSSRKSLRTSSRRAPRQRGKSTRVVTKFKWRTPEQANGGPQIVASQTVYEYLVAGAASDDDFIAQRSARRGGRLSSRHGSVDRRVTRASSASRRCDDHSFFIHINDHLSSPCVPRVASLRRGSNASIPEKCRYPEKDLHRRVTRRRARETRARSDDANVRHRAHASRRVSRVSRPRAREVDVDDGQ